MSSIVEGFSISHAMIMDGVTPAGPGMLDGAMPDGDIYGVREGGLTTDEGSFDNTGDDAVLSSWFWWNFVNVSVRAGYVPFATIARLTGATVTSTSAASGFTYELPIWTKRSLNQPTRPVLLRIPSKDHTGATRNLDIVLYKVQFTPIKFDGPNYKAGLLLDYSGRALVSPVREDGSAITDPEDHGIGRLISRPV